MGNSIKKFITLGLVLVGIPLLFVLLGKADHQFGTVKYFVPEKVVEKEVDGKMVNDTIWSKIIPFKFTNQNGETITEKDYEGHIYVADFFFTTCPTICPVMTKQMNQLIWQLDGKPGDDIRYLSFTVDPEFDTPEVLHAYAKKNEVNGNIWNMVTGEKDKIYQLGVNSFKLSTQEDVLAPGGFLHSNLFVLIDEEKHIRGYYDGTNSEQVRILGADIKKLVSEKKQKELAKRKKL
ncbi:MAG: protein SCO1/2 [Ulvibacter sp.]|jgi:protein SCO1/2